MNCASTKSTAPVHSRCRCFLIFTVFLATLALPLAAAPVFTEATSASTATLNAGPRTVIDFDHDWRFSKGDFDNAMMPGFNDSQWRLLNVPHDWSIEEPRSADLASATGFAPGGIGWYRKTFHVDDSVRGKLVSVEFDGIYNHSEIWLNGQLVGGRPYGYSSFECDLAPFLRFGGDNVLAVRVDHSKFADSRWYSGSGIYRHVRLRITNKLRIAPNGLFVSTSRADSNLALVRMEGRVLNGAPVGCAITWEILNQKGSNVFSITQFARSSPEGEDAVYTAQIAHPQLWSPDSPVLYTVRATVQGERGATDVLETHFGIRTFQFDPDKGFSLNGVPMKLKGVCLHHEAGAVGAAVPIQIWERRLRTLKEIGVNAIRTSHNPPTPEFLDLCDRLGFLVKDEAFDEFGFAKNKWIDGWNSNLPSHFGYSEDFREWSVRDIQDMVRRDRNHPSIILWSIGNEIDYANDPYSNPVLGENYHPENPSAEYLVKFGRPLVSAVKELDPTRPVTAAMANVAMSDAVGFGEMLDVAGYNYQEHRYAADHAKYPKRILYGSETSHRYDAWLAVRDYAYVCGQFLWTGIDYLGEAGHWPNHGSSAGLLDVCGFKKPLAWWRQGLWSDKPMVYLCTAANSSNTNRPNNRGRFRAEESWNAPANSTVTVRCYTTCEEVQLSLNGKVIGTKPRTAAVDGTLSWEIPFAPGTLVASGRNGNKTVAEYSLKTAGAARRIELLPDVRSMDAADGVCQVEYQIVDAHGVRVPNAENEVKFVVQGPGTILGIENGNLNTTESYRGNAHTAFQGRGLLILQSTGSGSITLKATSRGLEPAAVAVRANDRSSATY